MKKIYLTGAGIVAALILAGMFIAISFSATPFPFLPIATTIDPITEQNVDGNNIMILTGTTALSENTYNGSLRIAAIPGSLHEGNQTGWATTMCHSFIISGNSGTNRWRGVCDISELQPADYRVTLQTFELMENFTRIEHDPLATAYFTLADGQAGTNAIHKKTRVVQPFIQINPPDQKPPDRISEIAGITSLAPGTPLIWSLQPATGESGDSSQEEQGTAQVIAGIDDVNRWYARPTAGDLAPGRYRFRIVASPEGTGVTAGTFSAESAFDVPPLPSTPQNATGILQVPQRYIAIDALPPIRTNSVYTLTGTTSLPAGNVLQVQVYPVSFETNFNFTFDPRESGQNVSLVGSAVFSGASAGVDVKKGGGGENLWSFRLETYHMNPGQYRLNVSNYGDHPANATPVPGNLFSSEIFAVTE